MTLLEELRTKIAREIQRLACARTIFEPVEPPAPMFMNDAAAALSVLKESTGLTDADLEVFMERKARHDANEAIISTEELRRRGLVP